MRLESRKKVSLPHEPYGPDTNFKVLGLRAHASVAGWPYTYFLAGPGNLDWQEHDER